MTAWDRRVFLRALGGAVLGLVVVWLVTAASDEGQLTVGARAGRTLPLAPLCSAVGAALALGTARVRDEVRAFEAIGRAPAQIALAGALGAAAPTLAIALAIASVPRVDVGAFYPRAPRGDTFLWRDGAFVSSSLGVRVEPSGETTAFDGSVGDEADADLPRGARPSAALATGIAGLALALVAARGVLRTSFLDDKRRRAVRSASIVAGLVCAVATLVAFQAAGARSMPAFAAAVPPSLLLVLALVRDRTQLGGTR